MFELKLKPYILTWHNPYLNEVKKVNKLELTITYNKEIVYYKQSIASENDQFEFLILQTKNYKPHKIYNSMIDFLIEHEYCELIEKSNYRYFDKRIMSYNLKLTSKALLQIL